MVTKRKTFLTISNRLLTRALIAWPRLRAVEKLCAFTHAAGKSQIDRGARAISFATSPQFGYSSVMECN